MMIGVLVFGVLAHTTVIIHARTCGKGFDETDTVFPDDELMNAFYTADPDPETGFITFTENTPQREYGKIMSMVTANNLTYNEWLIKRHDGIKHFENLWVYVSRLISSDMTELYVHYQTLTGQPVAKPRSAIDFEKLKSKFSDVCNSYDKYGKTWPFSCHSSEFFCSLSKAFDKLESLLMSPGQIGSLTCSATTRAPLFVINEMSELAVDSEGRREALKMMFHADIIAEFSEDILLRPLYQSGLVSNSLYVLLEDNQQTSIHKRLQQFYTQMVSECTGNSKSALGRVYYCKAKEILAKELDCFTNKKTTCIFSPLFQKYFEVGRFISSFDREIMKLMQIKTGNAIKSVVRDLESNNVPKMQNTVNLYSPYLQVTGESCSYYWPKAFSCGKDEQCTIRTLYRSDCMVYFLINAIKNFLEAKGGLPWTNKEVIKSKAFLNVFLFYPPYLYDSNFTSDQSDAVITILHKEVDRLRNKFDVPGFEKLTKLIPPDSLLPNWVKRNACFTLNIKSINKPYCLVSSMVDAIQLFTESVKNSLNAKTRILVPSIDYRLELEQLQISRVSAYLDKQSQTYFNILANKLDEIPGYLQENFAAVGTYFGKLAAFDEKKSKTDIENIEGGMNDFFNLLTIRVNNFKQDFATLWGLSIGATSAAVFDSLAQLVLEIAMNCNPLKQIFGGTDPGAIVDRVAAVTNSIVYLTQTISLAVNVVPDLLKKAQSVIDGLNTNAEFLGEVKFIIDNFDSNDKDVESSIDKFLNTYSEFSPAIELYELVRLGELWASTIDSFCDAAFSSASLTSSIVQTVLAAMSTCTTLNPRLSEIMAVLEDIFENQFVFLETLALACRAKYAGKLAGDMEIAYTTNVKADINFIKNNAIMSYLVSILHIWNVILEYCDILTYTNGGKVPQVCVNAKQLPDQTNAGRVISYRQDAPCNEGSRVEHQITIPTYGEGTGKINLVSLLQGREVILKIPDPQWLIDRGVIPEIEADNAIYIEQFQLFLPLSFANKVLVDIDINPSNENVLRKGEIKYIVPLKSYNTRYSLGYKGCSSDKEYLPYDYCETMTKVCMLRSGRKERLIQPSIYNKWKIQVRSPAQLESINPKTNMDLIANLIYCTDNNLAWSKRADGSTEILRRKREGNIEFCCKNNQYLASDESCHNCPTNSTRKLSGHYCA